MKTIRLYSLEFDVSDNGDLILSQMIDPCVGDQQIVISPEMAMAVITGISKYLAEAVDAD